MSGTAQVSIICVSINSLPADSNTSKKSFDTVEQRISKQMHPGFIRGNGHENPGIVEAFAEHDSRFQGFIGMFCRGEPEYIYLKSAAHQPIKFSPHQLEIPYHFC